MITDVSMKVVGSVILNMGKAMKNLIINVYIKENMLMVSLRVWGDIVGLMVNFIRANG